MSEHQKTKTGTKTNTTTNSTTNTTKTETKKNPSSTTKQSTSNGKKYTPCHTGNVHALAVKYKERVIDFWVGGTSRSGGWDKHTDLPDLVIAPSSVIDPTPGLPANWAVSKYFPTMLPIPWPDFAAPRMPVEFWKDLTNDILEDERITKVQIECVGGHGRTGTALCILAHHMLMKWGTVDDLVAHFRKLYCDHIVESTSQMEYIEKATGLIWMGEEEPYKSSYSGGSSHGWGGGSSYYGGAGSSSYNYGYTTKDEMDKTLGKSDVKKAGDVISTPRGDYIPGYWDANNNWVHGHYVDEEEEDDTGVDLEKLWGPIDEEVSEDQLLWSEAQRWANEWGIELYAKNGRYYLDWDDGKPDEEFETLEDVVQYFQLSLGYTQ